ncbi:MAG: HEAT repeat domain-containing protein [Cyanobacteria bacterium K_Offshore_surface_m2_239]|nr:HEAT repeat domain-containing protein [Cyanobacteria bacterium K_Offshore_surface_m2_239]
MTCFERSPLLPRDTIQARFAALIDAVERADSASQLLQATRTLAQTLSDLRQDSPAEPPPVDALACLVRILGFNNPGAAVAAVEGLIACGPDAVAVLLGGLDDRNYGAKAWAVRALAGIGDVRGLAILEQALADDVGPSVRRAAAIGMGTLRVSHLAPEHRQTVRQRSLSALQGASKDSEWVVRYAVAAALEKLCMELQARERICDEALSTLNILADIEREDVPVVRLRARLALNRLLSPRA